MGASGSTPEEEKLVASVGEQIQNQVAEQAARAKIAAESGEAEGEDEFVNHLSLHDKIKAGWAADRMILDLGALRTQEVDPYWAQKARFWPALKQADRELLRVTKEVEMREKDCKLDVGEPAFVGTSALIVDEIGLYMRTTDQVRRQPKEGEKKEEEKEGEEKEGDEEGGEDGEGGDGEGGGDAEPQQQDEEDEVCYLFKKLVKTRITQGQNRFHIRAREPCLFSANIGRKYLLFQHLFWKCLEKAPSYRE